jgi:RNA polymerase sigma-70 factor, ECF subfamily
MKAMENSKDRMLTGEYERARESWPGVALPREEFVRQLSTLLNATEGRALEEELERLALADLYLACACAHRVPGAVEALERHHLAKLPRRLKYVGQPEETVEDVCQQVRIHLLVGTAESPPKIAEYTGRGSLSSWLKAIGVRMLLKRVGANREEPEDDVVAVLEETPTPGRGPELELIKQRYQRDFRQALSESFNTLPREQRHLLRLRYVDRLTQVQMARLFGVTQPTILRRLERAYGDVFEQTKRLLQERLGLSSLDFESLLEEVRSQFDMSLSQVLIEGDSSEVGEEAGEQLRQES